MDSNDRKLQGQKDDTASNFMVSAAEGDASHSASLCPRQHSCDSYDRDLENGSILDASAGEICFSPNSEKQGGDYHNKFSNFEEALENPHFDKAVAASMLKTFRSYLDAHETKDKQQREKIRKLEKQLRSTSEFIQKQCDGGLSSGDAKKEVDSLRSNLVSRDAELLRIENELEKQTLEFDRYKSETSKQIFSLIRKNETLHQELNARKYCLKPESVTSEKNTDLLEQFHNNSNRCSQENEFLSTPSSNKSVSNSANSNSTCGNCSILESQQEDLLAGRLAFEATLKAVKEILENIAFNRHPAVNSNDDGKSNICTELKSPKKKSVESQTISYNELCQQYLDHINTLKENICTRVKHHESTIAELQDDMEKQSRTVTSLQSQKRALIKEVESLKHRLQETEEGAARLSQKWQEDLKNAENTHKSALKVLQSEVQELSLNLETERKNHSNSIAKFEATVEQQASNQENMLATVYQSRLQEIQLSYNNDIKSYSNRISELEEQLRSATAERYDLIQQLQSRQSELQNAQLDNDQSCKEIQELVKVSDNLRLQLENMRSSKEIMEKELEALRCKVTLANKKVDEVSQQNKNLWKVFIERSQAIMAKDPETWMEKMRDLSIESTSEFNNPTCDSYLTNADSLKNFHDVISEASNSKDDSGILGSNASTTILISKVRNELDESSFLNKNITDELILLRGERVDLFNRNDQLTTENNTLKSALEDKVKKENLLRETNRCLEEQIVEYERRLSHLKKLCEEKREYQPAEGECGSHEHLRKSLSTEERRNLTTLESNTSLEWGNQEYDHLSKVKCDCGEVIESLKQKIVDLERKLAESISAESVHESVEQLIVEKESLLQKDFERLQQNRLQLEKEETLRAENQVLKSSIQEVNLRNQELETEIKSLSNVMDVKLLETEKSKLQALVNQLKDEENSLSEEVESLRSKKTKLVEEMNYCHAQKRKIEKDSEANVLRTKSDRQSLPLSSSLEHENIVSDGNKLYSAFANFDQNPIIATSTPFVEKLKISKENAVNKCNFILEEEEDVDLSGKNSRVEDLTHPFIISLECMGDVKALREENRKLLLDKHNLSTKLQTLQSTHDDVRLKLDQVTQTCLAMEKKIEELESSKQIGNTEQISFNTSDERAKINARIDNLENFLANCGVCEDNIETYQDLLELKEKVNMLIEYKCRTTLRLQSVESKIAGLNDEIKALWSVNNEILSKGQLNLEEIKLTIENNVMQIISNMQNQNGSGDQDKCFELIDCLVSEVKDIKTDLIEKKRNLHEVLLKQSKLISGVLQNGTVGSVSKADGDGKLSEDERKKFLQIVENQEQLIHQFQEKKALEVQLEEEHSQRLTLQTQLELQRDVISKKDSQFKDLEKKVVRLEVEKEVNQVELKRCQDQIKQLELQMQFCTRFLKAKDDVNALESKVKSVDVKPFPKPLKSSQIPILVPPLPSPSSQRLPNLYENRAKSPSIPPVQRQTSCSSDSLNNTRKLSRDVVNQLFVIRNSLQKNCNNFQRTLCKTLSLPEDSLDSIDFSDIIQKKKHHDEELARFKSVLSSEGSEIYETLRTKFENYSQQQIALAVAKLKKEHEIRMEREIENMTSVHNIETQLLEFEFKSRKCEELSQWYEELSSKFSQTTNFLESEILESVDNETILQHFQRILCAKYIYGVKGIISGWKNAVSSELSSILKEASKLGRFVFPDTRSDSFVPAPDFKLDHNIANLLDFHEKIIKSSNEFMDTFISNHKSAMSLVENSLKETHGNILSAIEKATQSLIEPETEELLRNRISDLEKEKKDLEQEFELAVSLFRSNLDAESPEIRAMLSAFRSSNKDVVKALGQLRQELEAKHQKEMVGLRTYFERIMEKHSDSKAEDGNQRFSDDVIKQQNSKICISGSDSETEPSAGAGEMLFKYSKIANNFSLGLETKMSFKEKVSDSEEQLEKIKAELEEKYCAELNLLKSEHTKTVDEMTAQMNLMKQWHKDELQSMEWMMTKEKDKLDRLKEEHSKKLLELNHTHEKQMAIEIEKTVQKMKREESELIKALKEEWEKSVKPELNDEHREQVVQHLSQAAINKALNSVALESKVKELEENLASEQEKLMEFNKSMEDDLKKFKESQDRMIENVTAQSEVKLQALKTEKETEIQELTKKYRELTDKLKREFNQKLKNQEVLFKAKELEFENQLKAQGEKLESEHKHLMAKLFERQAIEFAEQEEKFRFEGGSGMKKDLNDEIDSIKKERDFLKQISSTLRCVVNELGKYLITCEDELNKTLVEEILRLSETSDEDSDNSLYSNSYSRMQQSQPKKVKRVHFAPEMSSIMNQLNDSSFHDFIENRCDFSEDIRNELDSCLERLKVEAATLLGLTSKNSSRLNISDILNESLVRVKKVELIEKLRSANRIIDDYKNNTKELENELEQLKDREKIWTQEIERLKNALVCVENVTEGYGENCGSLTGTEKCRHVLMLLQDKARGMISTPQQTDELHHILDELCIASEKLSEESKRDIEDLQQQLMVAHERIRSTNLFLEEQAAERELERDEYVKTCENFRKQLQSAEQERSLHTSIATDMEAVQQQLRDSNHELAEVRAQQRRCEEELKAALEKVWTLRDVVSDLEKQLAIKSEHEVELEKQLNELLLSNRLQTEDRACLLQKIKTLQDGIEESVLVDKIKSLQDQLHKHGSSDIIRHIRAQIIDVERLMVKQTKELENIHETTNSCLSSPSEEISIREQLERMNCVSPNRNDALHPQCLSPVSLPVDETTRLLSVVHRHCRAEEVAIKRWRDTEMFLKTQIEELRLERDVLQQKLDKQNEQIASAQHKLEQYRLKLAEKKSAEDAEMLEKIAEFESETNRTIQKLNDKDKQLAEMSETLKKTSQMMERYKSELQLRSQNQWGAEEKRNAEIEMLTNEVARLTAIIKQNDENSHLMDMMVEDKNADIDSLQKEVANLKQQIGTNEQTNVTQQTSHRIPHSFTFTVSQSTPNQEKLRDALQELEKSNICPEINLEEGTKGQDTNPPVDPSITQPSLLSPELAPLKQPWASDVEKERRITHLNSSLMEMKSKLDEKNTKIQNLESQLSHILSLQSDLHVIKNENKLLFEEKEQTERDLTVLLDSESRLKAELSKKMEEILSLKDLISDKEEASIKLSSDVQGLKLVVEKLKKSNDDAKLLCKELEDEKNAVCTQLSQLQDENRNLKCEVSQIGAAAQRVQELEKEISSFIEMKETCESLQRENENLIKSMSEIVQDNKVLKDDLSSVKKALEDSEIVAQSLRKQLGVTAAENKELKQYNVRSQKELESIKQLNGNLESLVQSTKAECENLRSQVDALERTNEELKAQFEHAQSRLRAGSCEWNNPIKSLYVPFDETGKGVFESLQLVQAELAEERNRLASVKEKYDSLKVSYQKALESKKMSEKKLQDLKGSLNLAREKENDINHSNLALDLNGYQPRSLMEMEGLTSHRGTGSVEDLTRCVQEELNRSKQLDDTLITSLTPTKHCAPQASSESHAMLMESVLNYQVQIQNLETLLNEERKKVKDLQLKLDIVEQVSTNITTYQDDRLVNMTVELSTFKEKVPFLELELLESQTQVKQLQTDLLARKRICFQLQQETALLVESHQKELNKILDAKVHFELLYQKEKAKCEELQAQIKSSKPVQQESMNEQHLKEKLNEEQERCIKLEVELDQHKRYLTVLKSIKDKEASKSNTLEKDLDTLNSVKQALERQVVELDCLNRTEREKNRSLEAKIKAVEDADIRRQKRRLQVEQTHKLALQRASNVQKELVEECDRLRKELILSNELNQTALSRKLHLSSGGAKGDKNSTEPVLNVVSFEHARQLIEKLSEEQADFKLSIGRLQDSVTRALEEPQSASKLILDASSLKLLISRLDRAERYRRALIWQKRFLQIAYSTHLENQAEQLDLVQSCSYYETYKKGKPKRRNRFKAVAIMCVFIRRIRNMHARHSSPFRLSSLYSVPAPL
ncbi:uncharacterized protein [Bemisia tabaci]|uniref:uncharacterized protein isoform X1 n=1 Tax=Bemisia tabaci TaxID=7038 RepID=UPI003B286D64